MLVSYALVLLASLGLLFSPFVSTLEHKLLDDEFRLLHKNSSGSDTGNVVLIGIDDQTTATFPEPVALWHRHFRDLFVALGMGKPSVVGLDVTLPDGSYSFLDRGLDKALMLGLKRLSDAAPLVVGITVNADGETRGVYPPLLLAAGKHATGYVLWKKDRDQVVRRFTEHLGVQNETVPTLVGEMVRALGIPASEGLIDYTSGAAVQYISMQQVIAWGKASQQDKLKAAFAGKAVLIGSVLPFVDRHLQVINLAVWEDNKRFAPGVLLHLQALRNLQQQGLIQPVSMVWAVCCALLLTLLWWLPLSRLAAIVTGTVLLVGLVATSMTMLTSGYYLPVAVLMLTSALALMGRQLQQLLLDAMEKRHLRMAFGGMVSPQVMTQILADKLPEGERCRVCVLFADIRSFTTRSEKMEPEKVVLLLNRYFEKMTIAIHEHDGTLDKFMGDGIMAFFGAPNRLDNPSLHAFRAAVDMLDGLQELNKELESEGEETIRIGIGLHVGEVVVGQLGSSKRSEYTAIGDTVNTASRIEGLTKSMNIALLFSQDVYEEINDQFGKAQWIELGEVPIRGRSPLFLYGYDASDV